MEKGAIQPGSMMKAFAHKPYNSTLKVVLKSPLTTITKNQVKHSTLKHKHTLNKKENKNKRLKLN